MACAESTGRALVDSLRAALQAELIETHISWVLLAGDLAFKIKKPVRLPFVDYGTLAVRRICCEEEVRLNRRLAPSIYLGVSRITGTPDAPQLDGRGDAIEYAVRMCRFADGALFSERLAQGTLAAGDVDQLAALLGDFHDSAPVAAAADGFATAQRRQSAALAALEGAAALASAPQVAALRDWMESAAAALAPLWTARLNRGQVRECHGDLHLDNLVCLPEGVAAFDGIEFDPSLRWIDVIDDISFAVMDFAARGRSDFAFRLLNGWLDCTGDHGSLAALRFSAVYRALVRSEVEQLRGPARAAAARRYLEAALEWTRPPSPSLTITHGLPGSGKTFESQRMLERTGAIRLRSDVERKRLFGLRMLDDSRAHGLDLYQADATARTYAHLLATARTLLQAGWPVVLDAAFLRRDERAAALAVAQAAGVPLRILHCEAPTTVLRERLLARRGDASEADAAVLDHLIAAAQPLSTDELALVTTVCA